MQCLHILIVFRIFVLDCIHILTIQPHQSKSDFDINTPWLLWLQVYPGSVLIIFVVNNISTKTSKIINYCHTLILYVTHP